MFRRLRDAIILLVVAANGYSLTVCVCRYVSARHHRTVGAHYIDRDLTHWRHAEIMPKS